jgi:hypothetical protein
LGLVGLILGVNPSQAIQSYVVFILADDLGIGGLSGADFEAQNGKKKS